MVDREPSPLVRRLSRLFYWRLSIAVLAMGLLVGLIAAHGVAILFHPITPFDQARHAAEPDSYFAEWHAESAVVQDAQALLERRLRPVTIPLCGLLLGLVLYRMLLHQAVVSLRGDEIIVSRLVGRRSRHPRDLVRVEEATAFHGTSREQVTYLIFSSGRAARIGHTSLANAAELAARARDMLLVGITSRRQA